VADYKKIAARYGTLQDVDELIAQLKKRDMKCESLFFFFAWPWFYEHAPKSRRGGHRKKADCSTRNGIVMMDLVVNHVSLHEHALPACRARQQEIAKLEHDATPARE
jgi:hypothetical protein